jgi:hypothetical protein
MGPATRSKTSQDTSSESTSMPTSSSTMEQLPTYIPHLDPTGANWAIFCLHFRQAMITCCHWQYLEGTKVRPVPKDEEKPTDAETVSIEEWDHNNFMARFLLSQ